MATMTKTQAETLKKVAAAGVDGLDAYDMAERRYTTSTRTLGALIDMGLVQIFNTSLVRKGRSTRYRLTDTGRAAVS